MRKVDLFWQSNPDWWELRNHIPTVKEDAPQAAQESYARYLEQTTEREDPSIAPNWQEYFAPHILERGRGYFESGNVRSVQHCGGVYMASVTGTQDYEVEITVADDCIEQMHCNCPYAIDHYCKHMAAVLFALESGNVSIEELPPAKQPPIVSHVPMETPWLEAIDHLPEAVVRKELLKRADRDERLRERLAILYLGKLPEGQLQNWKADLQDVAAGYTDRRGCIREDDVWDFLNDLGNLLDAKLPLLFEVKAVMDAFHLTWIVMETALEWSVDDPHDEMGFLFVDCEEALRKIYSMATDPQREQMLQWYQEHRDEDWPGNVAYMDRIFKTLPQPEAPKIQKRLVRFINNIPCFLREGEWVAFPKRHFVYYDFIEETEAYKEAEPIIEELLKKKLGNLYGKPGSCHLDWHHRKQLLMEHYGIEWFTPVELNPGVHFD
jgi:hypothetical protein